MSQFTDYKYNLTKVTAIAIDTYNGNYLWIAFAKNSNGVCLLKKVSANNLSQVYYTVSVPVDSINSLVVVNNFVTLAVTHATKFTYYFSVTNPLTNSGFINKPVGVTESPIALTTDGSSYIYALTPGTESLTVATVVQITTANVYNATISLDISAISVNDASCITIDASNNLWIATNTTPINLYRVFYADSQWNIQETILS